MTAILRGLHTISNAYFIQHFVTSKVWMVFIVGIVIEHIHLLTPQTKLPWTVLYFHNFFDVRIPFISVAELGSAIVGSSELFELVLEFLSLGSLILNDNLMELYQRTYNLKQSMSLPLSSVISFCIFILYYAEVVCGFPSSDLRAEHQWCFIVIYFSSDIFAYYVIFLNNTLFLVGWGCYWGNKCFHLVATFFSLRSFSVPDWFATAR